MLLKIINKIPWDNWITRRVRKSLERDQEFSLGYLLKKGFTFSQSLLLSRFYLRKCDEVGSYSRTEKKPYIVNNGKIIIGNHVNITSRSVQSELVTYPSGEINIGENVFINFGTTIVAKKKVSIGNNVKIGPYSMIHDTDFHVPGKDFVHSQGKPIVIEDNAWINSRVLIMKGTIIGEGSVIAAGSVVSGIIPPNVVAGGVPAKILKKVEVPGESDGTKSIPKNRTFTEESEHIKKIMAQVLDVKVEDITPATSPTDISDWSSHKHQILIEELESQFDINIDPNDQVRMCTYRKICSILRKLYVKK